MPIEARAGSTNLQFSTTSELIAALHQSLEEGRGYGDPVVRVGHDDAEPAWLWIGGLLAQRSDWSASVGVALQHTVWQGDQLVREAFVDAMASVRQMVSLFRWTEPLVAALGPAAGRHARLDWAEGNPMPRLDEVLAGQLAWRDAMARPQAQLPTEGWRGAAQSFVTIHDEASLRAALRRSAQRGRFAESEWGNGPASWLQLVTLVKPWADAAVARWVAEALRGPDAGQRMLAIEWLLDGRDLWRYTDLLDELVAKPPSWWGDDPGAKVPGWARPLRVPWGSAATVGLVLTRRRTEAKRQLETPAVIDVGPVAFT